jgi:hypothetical protein
MEEQNQKIEKHIFFKLSEIKRKLKDLPSEDLKLLVSLGKISDSLLGYPVATLTSSSGSSTDYQGDRGRMLLCGISSGMGEEFIENSASLGGMGLAALLGFSEMSENLGSTALTAMALGGFLGMSLLPPPSMFGNYIFYKMALGRFTCPAYLNAKPLPYGDNFEAGNGFLAHGPFGSSPAGTMMGLLSGLGRTVMPGEVSPCPGALMGFCGKYGFY